MESFYYGRTTHNKNPYNLVTMDLAHSDWASQSFKCTKKKFMLELDVTIAHATYIRW